MVRIVVVVRMVLKLAVLMAVWDGVKVNGENDPLQ